MLTLKGAGSVARETYAFNTAEGIYIECGCFNEMLEQFREKVSKDQEYKHKVYLAWADFLETVWSEN